MQKNINTALKRLLPRCSHNNEGFTLVELLLVVIIIGILSGVIISVINVSGLRAKARDAQRVGDLEKIQLALELYFADFRSYPLSVNWILINGTSDALSSALLPNSGNVYINTMPVDPNFGMSCTGSVNTPCSDITCRRYNYISSSTGSLYILTSIVEVPSTDDNSKCIDLRNWSSTTCGSGGTSTCGCTTGTTWNGDPDYCLGVENPL